MNTKRLRWITYQFLNVFLVRIEKEKYRKKLTSMLFFCSITFMFRIYFFYRKSRLWTPPEPDITWPFVWAQSSCCEANVLESAVLAWRSNQSARPLVTYGLRVSAPKQLRRALRMLCFAYGESSCFGFCRLGVGEQRT